MAMLGLLTYRSRYLDAKVVGIESNDLVATHGYSNIVMYKVGEVGMDVGLQALSYFSFSICFVIADGSIPPT